MILAHVPTFTPGQTVLTFPERPMVSCGTTWQETTCGEVEVLRPLAPGDRVAIAVPCPKVYERTFSGAPRPHGRKCVCHGLGSLIVASGTVADMLVFRNASHAHLTDVQPTTVRCPACWGEQCLFGDVEHDGPCEMCARCSNGTCPPIPVQATPGLQEWQP
jgi:hypothetical protein